MQLTTLGRAQVAAGRTRIGPDAPVAFPLLLHLALERDRAVPRVHLQELIFPEQTARNASHSLRQSVYKLRTQGFPIEGSGGSMHIAAAAVRDDYTSLLTPQLEGTRDLTALMGGWLPGFDPSVSPAYSHWFEEKRAEVAAQIRSSLLSELILHKRHGRWQALEQTSRAVLMLDPLNEEATFGLAEALALSGSKVEAVRILDRYQEEVPTAELRLPASVLKRRISERTPERPPERKQPIFVGREKEMEALTDALGVALSGVPTGVIVHGEPGIGKTRLLQEASGWAAINGFRIATHTCRPHDVKRPLGVIGALVPLIRAMPGALGCAPEALAALDGLHATHGALGMSLGTPPLGAEVQAATIAAAVEELIAAVSSETPLLLLIDDMQWADQSSTTVLFDLVEQVAGPHALVAGLRQIDRYVCAQIGRHICAIALQPLPETAVDQLLASEIGVKASAPPIADWVKPVAQGNPLFLLTLTRHSLEQPSSRSLPLGLSKLLEERLHALDGLDTQVFASICALGRYATFDRIERLLQATRTDLIASLERLELRGFLATASNRLEPIHPLYAEGALQRLGTAARRYLYHACSVLLEGESSDDSGTEKLWDLVHLSSLSGDNDRTMALARRCAGHALSLGEADTACTILQQALASSVDHTDSTTLKHELLVCARGAGRWRLALDLATELLRTPPDRDATTCELRFAHLEADWQVTHDYLRLTSPLLSCVHDPRLLPSHRIRAAELVVISAANMHDQSASSSALDAARILVDIAPEESNAVAAMEMIYEMSFGSLATAETLAEAIVSWASSIPLSMSTARALCNSATVISHAGNVERAIYILEDVFTRSTKRKLLGGEHRAAGELYYLLLTCGRIDEARIWHEKQARTFAALGSHADPSVFASMAFWIYFADGDRTGMQQCTDQLLSTMEGRNSRGRGFASAIAALCQLKAHERKPGPHELDSLIAMYVDDPVPLEGELWVFALCELLSASAREPEAFDLAAGYVRDRRRELRPVSSWLRRYLRP